jgi:ribonuclease HI
MYSEVILECVEKIQILSDSQSAVVLLTLGWKPNQLHQTLASAKNLMPQLERKDTSVIIDWTPGHAAIAGNEIADRLANEPSDTAKGVDTLDSIVTLGTIKRSARESRLNGRDRATPSRVWRTEQIPAPNRVPR